VDATSDRLSRWTPVTFPLALVNLVLAGPAFQLLTVLLGLSSKANTWTASRCAQSIAAMPARPCS
jgi:hypothetical protein